MTIKFGEWISVDEALPKYTHQVCGQEICFILALIGKGCIDKVMFCDGKFEHDNFGDITNSVKYWMPLPPLPEDINND